MRVAVIGSGISGLGAAWALKPTCDVTLYESADRLGGHSNTVSIQVAGSTVDVDTGFIVYNEPNYPNLKALFAELGIQTEFSDMSFAVSADGGRLEYAGDNISTLFAQRLNIVRPRFLRLLADVVRFNRNARALLAPGGETGETLGQFLDRGGYSQAFLTDHLLPMGAAIWSAPMAEMRAFPMQSFARFFDNHGLIQLTNRPRWRTVKGGSRRYVAVIAEALGPDVIRHAGVTRIMRHEAGVAVTDASGETDRFDQVILACHADQALAMLGDADAAEQDLLGAFRFQPNRAYLHRDPALMPKRRKVWASWNYLADRHTGADHPVTLSYWMNRLQPLETSEQIFVTLNPATLPKTDLTHAVIDYEHPLFNQAAIAAQRDLGRIQGVRRTWFAGAWTGYGFHEDGLRSGLAAAEALGGHIPWRAKPSDLAA